ncbi:MAG: glycosyltransferase family 4 protein [bacterium]|nr:glycosyltransferase family 4 protein [bacterium]
MIGAKGMPATIGGVERHVEALSSRLAASGVRVTVYGRAWYMDRHPGTVRTEQGVRVVALPSLRTKHLDAISYTFMATLHAMREHADIYHFHGVGPSLLAWMPRVFRPRSRVVVTFHCVDRRHAKWGVIARAALWLGEWAACTFPHQTITVGETLTAYCRATYGAAPVCIPNGVVPLAPDATSERAHDLLRANDIAPGKYLLVASRLVAHKEIHTVIQAFRQLRQERPEQYAALQLVIAGAPAFTDAYAEQLHAAAAGDTAIRFVGQRSGRMLDALFANCLAFVHASRAEGLPIAVLDAAGAGAVPIVSDIPEHCEIIQRVGGVLFETGNAWDLACKLEVVIANAPHLREIGDGIRDATLRHYHWDTCVAQVAGLYRALQPDTRTVNRARRVSAPRYIV